MQKYWLTVSVPVQAESPKDAQDKGWELLIDPDGPAEGLVEHVAEGEVRPEILATNSLEQAA